MVENWLAIFRRSIMNGIDAYFRAKLHISEWISLSVPLLKVHIKLITDYSPAKDKAERGICQKMLSDGIEKMKSAQMDAAKMIENFNSANETLSALFQQFERDFNEKSEFFKLKLPKTTKDRKKAVDDLKLQLATVTNFYITLRDSFNVAVYDTKEFVDYLNMFIHQFNRHSSVQSTKEESGMPNYFQTIANDTELRDAVVKSAEDLIAKCEEYGRKRESTDN